MRRRPAGRTYDSVVALRAVTSVDGMTADFYPFDMTFLARAATRISASASALTNDFDWVQGSRYGLVRARAPPKFGASASG